MQSSIARLVVLVLAVASSAPAEAASCPYLAQISKMEVLVDGLNSRVMNGECGYVDAYASAMEKRNQAAENAVRKCKGFRLKQKPARTDAAFRESTRNICEQINALLALKARGAEPSDKIAPPVSSSPDVSVSANATPNGNYNPRSNCSTITGDGMSGGGGPGCGDSKGGLRREPGLQSSGKSHIVRRSQWKPSTVPPDVQVELFTLADSVIDTPDTDRRRPEIVRAFERQLASNRVAAPSKDLACLQPASKKVHRSIDIPLRWKPEHIKREAIDGSHLCDDATDGSKKDECREAKYGEAVMWAEPELAGMCRTANAPRFDQRSIAECAKTRFLNAWAHPDHIVSVTAPKSWRAPDDCRVRQPVARRKQELRDRLKAMLAAHQIASNDLTVDSSTPVSQEPVRPAETTAPVPPADRDDNEAYCNYMAREVVRGQLTAGDATALPPECKATIIAAEALKAKQPASRPFTMSSEDTDKEIAKLMAPE